MRCCRLHEARKDNLQFHPPMKRGGGHRLAGTYGSSEHLGYASTSFVAAVDKADARLLDEFSVAGIERAEDIVTRFVDRMWFGCEADDIMIPSA